MSDIIPNVSIDDNPRSYLWNDPQDSKILFHNNENYDLLLKSYSKSSFASFIGAGVSKSLGICDWNNLIDELYEITKSLGFSDIKPTSKEQYPEFTESLFKYLENINQHSLYFETISNHMIPHSSSTSVALIYLLLCIDIHLTTNFDRSLENAYRSANDFEGYFTSKAKQQNQELCYLYDLTPHSNGPAIIYLHGSVDHNIYILKKSDYDRFYPSISGEINNVVKDLEDCLRHYYRSKHIIFIGFSFEDPYLQKFFFNFAKELQVEQRSKGVFYAEGGQIVPDKKIKHFLLIDESNKFVNNHRAEVFSTLQEYNLYPIIYRSGEHVFLEYLFRELMRKNKGEL